MTTSGFIKADFWSTLYPLKTNLIILEHHEEGVSKYIYEKILANAESGDNFLPQQRVYATKPHGHLRRTVKLDPIAEYFIYDLVYRNRASFRKSVSDARASFGYRFIDGAPVPINSAFREYRKLVSLKKKTYKHHIKFDIASYFNSLYHHDLAHWFSSKDSVTEKDAGAFGRYLREINAGRSVDLLPHGIYPAKMIGNEFLKSVDSSGFIKSSQYIRFMDDFYLFDDSEKVIAQDFVRIQQLLGNFALNVNPAKTAYDDKKSDVASAVTSIQKSLSEVIEVDVFVDTPSGVEVGSEEVEIEHSLSATQIETLLAFLKDESLEESDADLILNVLRTHSDSVLEYLPILLERFPNIYKHLYVLSASIVDKQALAEIIRDFIAGDSYMVEHQLFWLAVIAEEVLAETSLFGEILLRLYELTGEYKIARAKVLEIPCQNFGFKEIRADFLKTGSSDWLSWASAVGSRSLQSAERNYALDYFSKGSPMNFLVATAAKKV